ncbi:hypothetical protein NL676_028077 [Syzygium grande]|nr:hypothetical protein NL676_028077 [Syzygium grande]
MTARVAVPLFPLLLLLFLCLSLSLSFRFPDPPAGGSAGDWPENTLPPPRSPPPAPATPPAPLRESSSTLCGL